MTQYYEIDPQPLRMGNYLIESVACLKYPSAATPRAFNHWIVLLRATLGHRPGKHDQQRPLPVRHPRDGTIDKTCT